MFSYFTIYYWINQLGKDIEKIKKHCRIRFKKVWHADKKYVKHKKGWVYRLNLIDSKRNVIASFVSKEKDEEAAKLLMKLGIEEAEKKL